MTESRALVYREKRTKDRTLRDPSNEDKVLTQFLSKLPGRYGV